MRHTIRETRSMLRILIVLLVGLVASTALAQNVVPTSLSPEIRENRETTGESASDALFEAIKKGELARVIWLLENGVSADATDGDGQPALISAVKENRIEIAEILLVHGAKVDVEYDEESTPLQIAAAFGHEDMVNLLINHGANINHHDNCGHTALLVAAFGASYRYIPTEIAKAMFDEETASYLASMGNEHMAIVKVLLSRGADPNAQGQDCGLTPLMVAAMVGNVELGRMLLSAGARVDASGGDEFTALKLARMDETPEALQRSMEGESDEQSKQAILNWLQATRDGRREFAQLLKKAGAQN